MSLQTTMAYSGVGVLRRQRHNQLKLTKVPPSPSGDEHGVTHCNNRNLPSDRELGHVIPSCSSSSLGRQRPSDRWYPQHCKWFLTDPQFASDHWKRRDRRGFNPPMISSTLNNLLLVLAGSLDFIRLITNIVYFHLLATIAKVTTGLCVARDLKYPTRLQNAECRMLNSRFLRQRGFPREKVEDPYSPPRGGISVNFG